MADNMDKITDMADRIKLLEHQCSTILFLSAANMITNVVTIGLAVLMGWR